MPGSPRRETRDMVVMEDNAKATFDKEKQALVGRGGTLAVRDDDEITRKLCMLVDGECEGLGPLKAARKFGFSKQRYFQLRAVFLEAGAAALQSCKRGPKTHYRRTPEVVRQVIRHRFLDPDTHQPVCFTTATSACSATTAAIELLELGAQILTPTPGQTMVMADLEHLTADLFQHVQRKTPFDLLVPMKNARSTRKQLQAIPTEQFTRRWAGYATLKQPYRMAERDAGDLFQFVQRTGETPDDYHLSAFLSTTDRDEVDTLTLDYPKRWHVQEFFNAHQALGWKRAGTLNLNTRYGQMTMALLAQAALHQLRCRMGEPFCAWDAGHLAKSLLASLEGDVRVKEDTVVVTYYNAPNAEKLEANYGELPDRLERENINPQIPWLYGFKLDFRFR